MSQQWSADEVAKHNKSDDCWISVHGRIYNVTPFLDEHPGGKKVLLREAGKDATKQFDLFHKPDVLQKFGPRLFVGDLAGASSLPAKSKKEEPVVEQPEEPSSSVGGPRILTPSEAAFGERVPFGDPSWYQDWYSPFYSDSHKRFRNAVREFVEKEIMPFTHEWDEQKRLPREIYAKTFQAGILPAVAGYWPSDIIGEHPIAGGVKPEEFDAFHELILVDELSRSASGGVLWAMLGGLSIGLPPVIHFAPPELREKVAGPCLRGEKIICLAITEPYAGSDVAGLRTEARKTPDGKHYIVNGEKKWITNGVFADFFTVAVRTGGPGAKGVSLLLLERGMPGITTRQMNCSGVWPSGTTYITFEDVQVPVENLIGQENMGFKYIMANFNHERWGIAAQASRFARVCLEEAIKHAHKRKTFGVRLIDHPVIRNKVAHMARHVEATHSWLEIITYQLTKMTYMEQASRLGGPIALLKAQTTLTLELCAREASQIFGGLAYTRGGQGEKVERLYREVRAYAIPGGSEEIMLDLGVRQALRKAHL